MIVMGEVVCGFDLVVVELLALMACEGGYIMSFSVVGPPLELVLSAKVTGLPQ